MTRGESPDIWPPPHQARDGLPSHAGRPTGPPPPPAVDKGRIWAVALTAGAATYPALVAVHQSTATSGSAAYRAGEMVPIAAISAVVVALVAQVTNTRRGWPWWVITLAVVAASGLWYTVVEVAPRVTNDARAEASGQADYRLVVPKRAGEWTRLDGAGAKQRQELVLGRLEQAPADLRSSVDEAVYGEYRSGTARLVFLGFNASGGIEDELRDSPSDALRDSMAGVGADSFEPIDPGRLGGSMTCIDGMDGLPTGTILCSWADASTIAQVTIAQLGLDIEEAAVMVREFREHVTER